MNLGESVFEKENNYENKSISNFFPLKELAKDTIIEGVHKGRFESKKKEGYFFHVFENKEGVVNAYGTCGALDDRVKEVNDEEQAQGVKLYAEIKFHGRVPSKANPKLTYYRFSKEKLIKTDLPLTHAPMVAEPMSSEDIPF